MNDRLSFRRFVGLGLTDPTPDETSFVVFRKRLRQTGQAELTDEQKQHNRACSTVRALVEHSFGWLKQQMRYGRRRYRGLVHNAIDFAMAAMGYNIKRSLSLLGTPLTPSLPLDGCDQMVLG